MKFYLILIFGILSQYSAISQKDMAISFNYQEEALSSVMDDLEGRYALNFSFANDQDLLKTAITAEGNNLDLEGGLKIIFDQQPIDYRVMSGQVVLRYDSKLTQNEPPTQGAITPKKNLIPETTPERITYTPTREKVTDVEQLPNRRPGLFSINLNWDEEEEHDHHYRRRCGNNGNAGGFEFYTSEIFRYHLSFKNGGKNFYHLVNLSSDRIWPWNYKRSDPQWAFGIGLGYRARIFGIPLRSEFIVNHINEDKFISTRLNELGQIRLLLGIPFLGGEITIGPSFNYHISGILDDETGRIGSNLLPSWEESTINDEIGYYYWVGGTIGFLF